MFFSKTKKTNANEADSRSILDTCHLVATTAGSLRIQPLGATLTSDQLSEIIRRLSRSDCVEGFTEIVFDLGEVELIGPRWTVVLAMLIEFGRRVAARCRLVSLQGQPAAAAALYRRNAELMDMIATPAAA